MSGTVSVAAADLGAASGRVMVARVGAGQLEMREVHRFANEPVAVAGRLRTDILRLYADVLAGIGIAARGTELASLGIDSWGVDYGLLDGDGQLLGNPVHYRDPQSAAAVGQVLAAVSAAELYAVTGIQQLPINTIYQLAAAAGSPQLAAAATLLMIPDLLTYWLTGTAGAEVTNASTTQLYDVRARSWALPLMARIGIPAAIFPPLRRPGQPAGDLVPEAAGQAGLHRALPVIAVGSHDTASAVVAVPAGGRHFAYISCGTWSLVGMELGYPVLTEASLRANFSNETGIDGTIRYLRNVMGLWLLQESWRAWSVAGQPGQQNRLLADAARVAPLRFVIDPDDQAFLPPGDMPSRIASACRTAGQAPPDGPAETVRCILDSLALAHRRAVLAVQELTGQHVDTVHIVGGGARNELLCQLTADACELPVVAGPAEATAMGNVLVQARVQGAAPADLEGMRALVRETQPLRYFQPGSDARRWRAAAGRLAGSA